MRKIYFHIDNNKYIHIEWKWRLFNEKYYCILVYFICFDFGRTQKPKLTLYTKDNCSLCDTLVEELHSFNHRYDFEKIDITKNDDLFGLYRYEIPVLHLNGKFLCKHKLNVELLDGKLKEIENKNHDKY